MFVPVAGAIALVADLMNGLPARPFAGSVARVAQVAGAAAAACGASIVAAETNASAVVARTDRPDVCRYRIASSHSRMPFVTDVLRPGTRTRSQRKRCGRSAGDAATEYQRMEISPTRSPPGWLRVHAANGRACCKSLGRVSPADSRNHPARSRSRAKPRHRRILRQAG